MTVSNFLSIASNPALESIKAGIDRSFLDTVQDRFAGGGASPELLLIAGLTLAAAATMGALLYVLNTYVLPRRRGLPSGAITNQLDIQRLFDLAVAQRSKIELSFSRNSNKDQSVSCSLEDVRSEHLVLEITARIEAGPQWIGRTVNCYTRVTPPKEKGHSNFYFFTAEIAGLVKQADGSLRLTVTMPTAMRLQQKRVHLRLEPPMEYMLGLAIWPEQLQSNAKPELNFKKWGKPKMLFHAAKHDLLHVTNVSAGGMRLDVTRKALRETGLEFEPGQRYILLADIYDPDKQSKDRLWCLARVQNHFEDFETRKLEIGVRFVAQGFLAGEKAESIVWRPVGEDGIASLGDWVVKRHLELYRKHGAA